MNCPECTGHMTVQDSHWEWTSAATKVPVKYYKCDDCGHQLADAGDEIAA